VPETTWQRPTRPVSPIYLVIFSFFVLLDWGGWINTNSQYLVSFPDPCPKGQNCSYTDLGANCSLGDQCSFILNDWNDLSDELWCGSGFCDIQVEENGFSYWGAHAGSGDVHLNCSGLDSCVRTLMYSAVAPFMCPAPPMTLLALPSPCTPGVGQSPSTACTIQAPPPLVVMALSYTAEAVRPTFCAVPADRPSSTSALALLPWRASELRLVILSPSTGVPVL